MYFPMRPVAPVSRMEGNLGIDEGGRRFMIAQRDLPAGGRHFYCYLDTSLRGF